MHHQAILVQYREKEGRLAKTHTHTCQLTNWVAVDPMNQTFVFITVTIATWGNEAWRVMEEGASTESEREGGRRGGFAIFTFYAA